MLAEETLRQACRDAAVPDTFEFDLIWRSGTCVEYQLTTPSLGHVR